MKGPLMFGLLVIYLSALVASIEVKNLGGPPSEFQYHSIPDPINIKTVEKSASEFIWFQIAEDGIVYSTKIPVDDSRQFTFNFASPHEQKLIVELKDPFGKIVDLTGTIIKGLFPIAVDLQLPVTTYQITNCVQGDYTLSIRTPAVGGFTRQELYALTQSPSPNALLSVLNHDAMEIHTNFATYIIKEGQDIGLVTEIVNTADNSLSTFVSVTGAQMGVLTPAGVDLDVPMKDDGNSHDGEPGDGVYGAVIPATHPGRYIIQAKLSGFITNKTGDVHASKVPFSRSTQHFLDVSAATTDLTGVATMGSLDKDGIAYPVILSLTNHTTESLRAYAEVWGTKEGTKELIPVCWIGGLVEVSPLKYVMLKLHKDWISMSGASGPFTLRNVYLSDLSTSFPISRLHGDVPLRKSDALRASSFVPVSQITKEMRYGKNPLPPVKAFESDSPNLLLLPGYCAGVNPWERNTKDFTNGTYFLATTGSYTNNEYAKKVIAYIKEKNIQRFAIIAHSQGGMVSTHIHNYYWTGLEASEGGRKIQSLGTPFAGTTGAGSAGSLAYIFGVGCGANNDLTRDGAANWVTGISMEVRKDVYSYGTSYSTESLTGDYCSIAVNSVLQWPNDGITELNYAKLEGGNWLGAKQKWCHCTEMAYPAQYDDHERNAEMNKLAAR